jgi:hypothetical protein
MTVLDSIAHFQNRRDEVLTCRPKDIPPHSEKSLRAVNLSNWKEFAAAPLKRADDLSESGLARVEGDPAG